MIGTHEPSASAANDKPPQHPDQFQDSLTSLRNSRVTWPQWTSIDNEFTSH